MAGNAELPGEATRGVPRSTVEAATRLLDAGRRPVQAAFVARALNALAELVTELDDRSLADAAGATSDYAALLRALERPEAAVALGRKDPLLPARLRGLQAKRELLEAEGGALSAEQVAQLLGITRQAVDKRRRAGKLLALDTGRQGYAYPAWQLTLEGTLPGLEEVLADLGVESQWMRAGFFLGGNVRLGGETPLAELRRGHVDQVRHAARAYGEHGAA